MKKTAKLAESRVLGGSSCMNLKIMRTGLGLNIRFDYFTVNQIQSYGFA